MLVAFLAGCTGSEAERERVVEAKPVVEPVPIVDPDPQAALEPEPMVEPEPLVDGWRWSPDLRDLSYESDGSFAEPVELQHCRDGGCIRLLNLARGSRLGKLGERDDGEWAFAWYAAGERDSILAVFDLDARKLACTTDFSGAIDRPGSVEWVGDAIVHSWSAGTHLNEVAIWSRACAQLDSLGAAQVFLAPDLQRVKTPAAALH